MGKPLVKLIVINQTVNPAFCQWLCSLALAHNSIELWASNAPSDLPETILVRSAPAYDRSTLKSRLQTWLTFTIVVIWRLIRHWGRTPIFVVTNPPFTPLIALLLAKLQRRPYALLEWDIYPNILATMQILSLHNPIYQLWHLWHGAALRHANLVVTIGDCMANELRRLANSNALPIVVVPNWVDTRWIHPIPAEENPFIAKHHLKHKFIVLYSGNLGATHGIETVLEVAKALLENQRIQFLIIGDGDKRQKVEAAIAAGVTNILLLPWQSNEDLPFSLASGDVGVVTLAAGYETASMPSKTYNLLAAGAAILGISNAPNDLATTIEHLKCGRNYLPDQISDIAHWIAHLAEDRQRLAAYRHAARVAAVEQFDSQLCMKRLTDFVVENLLVLEK